MICLEEAIDKGLVEIGQEVVAIPKPGYEYLLSSIKCLSDTTARIEGGTIRDCIRGTHLCTFFARYYTHKFFLCVDLEEELI